MLRQTLVLTGLGLAMWVISTLFFILFGDWVLVGTDDSHFGSSLFLLEALTLLVLIGLSLIVRLRLFRQRGSATRFGYIAASTGLLLSALAIWNRSRVFSDLDESQLHAFSIWMTLAYAMTLLVPAATDRLVRTKSEEAAPADERPSEPSDEYADAGRDETRL